MRSLEYLEMMSAPQFYIIVFFCCSESIVSSLCPSRVVSQNMCLTVLQLLLIHVVFSADVVWYLY